MAESLAFWFADANGQVKDEDHLETKELELHFNYWSLDALKGRQFLDIGVKFRKWTSNDNLFIYLPFQVGKDDIDFNLSNLVASDIKLVSAIFNEDASASLPSSDDFYRIGLSSDVSFTFYTALSIGAGVGYREEGNGVCLSFDLSVFPKDLDNQFGYFRFRIPVLSVEAICKEYNAKGSWVTGDFEKIEVIDFRVNESRNLPSSIKTKAAGDNIIKVVHFFLIRDADADFKISHVAYKRCRLLESGLWDNYISLNGKQNNPMMIYHWSEKSAAKKIDHFAAFAKFSKKSISTPKILFLVLTIFFIGVLSGLATNHLSQNGENPVQSCPPTIGCSTVETLDSPEKPSAPAKPTGTNEEQKDETT